MISWIFRQILGTGSMIGSSMKKPQQSDLANVSCASQISLFQIINHPSSSHPVSHNGVRHDGLIRRESEVTVALPASGGFSSSHLPERDEVEGSVCVCGLGCGLLFPSFISRCASTCRNEARKGDKPLIVWLFVSGIHSSILTHFSIFLAFFSRA